MSHLHGAIGYNPSEIAFNADIFPTFNEQQSFDGIDRTNELDAEWNYPQDAEEPLTDPMSECDTDLPF